MFFKSIITNLDPKQTSGLISGILLIGLASSVLSLFGLYYVPTSSMENTILPGDYILIYKGINNNNIKNRDIYVYKDFDISNNIYLVKRCLAKAGDYIEIKSNIVYVNDGIESNPNESKLLYRFNVEAETNLTEIKKLFNLELTKVDTNIMVYATFKCINQLIKLPYVENVSAITKLDLDDGSRICNYPKTLIPKAKKSYPITPSNKLLLGNYFNDNEYDSASIMNNYYFMVGDNRFRSFDSRSLGVVPESKLVGKAILIVCSTDKSKSGLMKYRFNRIFRMIQ